MTLRLRYLSVLLSVAAAWAAAADPPPAGDGGEKPYHVEADVTEAWTVNTERVLHGTGHVLIIHDTTTITCDEVYNYEEKDLATLIGNVRVVDAAKKYTLTSGYAEYFRDKKMATASRNPKLVIEKDRPVTITGDLMQMWNDREYGEAIGNVHVVSEDVEGDGQKLKYFGKECRIELTGQPVVWQKDNRLAGDVITLFLEGERLRRALAEGSARLVYFSYGAEEEESEPPGEEGGGAAPVEGEDDGATSGDSLTIEPPTAPVDPPSSEAGEEPTDPAAADAGVEAEGNPSGRVEASGDHMEGFFTQGELDEVLVSGTAEGHYWPMDALGRETGEQVDLSGQQMRILARNGKIKKIVVNGDAEGVHRPASSAGRGGLTRTTGDTISVFVTASKVRRIVVTGHARGSYYAEEEMTASEKALPASK